MAPTLGLDTTLGFDFFLEPPSGCHPQKCRLCPQFGIANSRISDLFLKRTLSAVSRRLRGCPT
jgi:hypothetical protein